MTRLALLFLIAACLPIQAKVGDWRTLRDDQGKALMVRFEGIQDNRYLLRLQMDGRLFEVAPVGVADWVYQGGLFMILP